MKHPTNLRTPARAVVLAVATTTVLVLVQAPVRAAAPDPTATTAALPSTPAPIPAADSTVLPTAYKSINNAPATPSATPVASAPATRPSAPEAGPSATAAAAAQAGIRAAGTAAPPAAITSSLRGDRDIAIHALPVVTLAVSGPWSAGVWQTLSGTVIAIQPGPVTIDLQSWDGNVWTTRTTTTASNGTFATTWAPLGPGPMTWRAVASQPGYDQLVSDSVVVTVVAQVMITVSAVTAADVAFSYRAGCPVPPTSLRKISLNYWDFDGNVRRGTLIGAVWAVPAYESIFTTIFTARFPIQQVRPVDHYYFGVKGASAASDLASMAADNTSAFNCRKVTGNPYRMSRHSWGDAIDFNTVENPYLTPGHIYPANGKYFLDRHRYRTGMILPGSVVATAMARLHWLWGARWSNPDYQHFSSTGE